MASKVFTMTSLQKQAYTFLSACLFRLLNAPTGFGKSMLINFLAGQEIAANRNRKVLIAVPQTIIGKGFRSCRLRYPDGSVLKWDPGYDLCNGTERERIAHVREFLSEPRKHLRYPAMLCSHKSLALAYQSLRNRTTCFRNISIWIDEAHHILVSERGDIECAVVCNELGNMVRYVMDLNCRTVRLGLSTAYFFRGDRATIIPDRHLQRFERYHVPLDIYWKKHIKHIQKYRYDFVVYRDSYYGEITRLFRQRLGKTIIYVPWPNTALASGSKYKHVKKIITAIKKARPQAKIIDLVDEQGRDAKKNFVNAIVARNDTDVIIAMGMFREGADWIWADRVIDLAPSNSLQLQGQKFGRLLRDVPGKRRIEYFSFLPFVLDTLDEEKYRRSLSERFAAFTASLLIEDLVTPIEIPMPHRGKKSKAKAETKVNWFAEAIPDETRRQTVLDQVIKGFGNKGAELEAQVERGDRVSKTPTAAEADQVIMGVLRKNGVTKHLREVCRHIQLLLARKSVGQRGIDVQSLVDAGFDKVVKYACKAILSFGAGQCGCRTFTEFRDVLQKRNFYEGPEEWGKAVRKLGIASVNEYRKRHKEDPRLYRNPDKAYGIKWNKLMARPDKYETKEEFREAVHRLGITKYREYLLKHKQDPRLPHTPMRTFKASWNDLIGKQFYKSIKECRQAMKRLGIYNRTQYFKRYKEDPRLPSSSSHYGVNWMEYCGKSHPNFYPNIPAWMKAIKKEGVETKAQYTQARKKDPRLHSTPWSFYGKKNWSDLMGKKGKENKKGKRNGRKR